MAFTHEIVLALAALVLFFLTLFNTKQGTPRRVAIFLSAVVVASALWGLGAHGEIFSGTYRVDGFSQWMKLVIAVGFFIAAAFGEGGHRGVARDHEADYFLFLALSVMGLTFLVSAMELLTLYIALEVASYSLYILVPLRSSEKGPQVESAVKYAIFGAVASGVGLFGMSYVFGLAHTTRIDELVRIYPAIASTPLGLVALAMMFAGFFFKLALFPFHIWTPDVYQGSANETTGVIATLPKVGAVAALIRLSGLAEAGSTFTEILVLCAVLSMTYGNLAALVQNDVKRLLAFSSISHAGFMMAGILSGSAEGAASAIYYVSGYLLMNLAIFHVLCSLSPDGRNVSVDDLKGLHRRAPVLALTLAVGAFGLAGIPPTAGFAGKFFVLTSAFKGGHMWLVIIGALNTAISIFYYLRLVRAAYSPEVEGAEKAPAVATTITGKLLGVALLVSILVVGSFPGGVMQWLAAAFAHA